VGVCPRCPPHAKYPEFGGQTIWECIEREYDVGTTSSNPAEPRRKEHYTVTVRDLDTGEEAEYETHAYGRSGAISNAWYRLMRDLDINLPVGIFKKRYKDQYRFVARRTDE
jgi:hypothetical protein